MFLMLYWYWSYISGSVDVIGVISVVLMVVVLILLIGAGLMVLVVFRSSTIKCSVFLKIIFQNDYIPCVCMCSCVFV